MKCRTFCGMLACALTAIGILSRPVIATDRYYRDVSETSPAGRLKFTASSPDNAGERPRPFARNFEYVLTDTATSRVLWKRSEQDPPTGVYLRDDGWLVLEISSYTFAAFAPLTGERVLSDSVFDHFTRQEFEENVSHSTAGDHWAGNSRAYFLEDDDHLYFVVRVWWDKRIILDLTAARVIEHAPANLVKACQQDESAWALSVLTKAAERWAARDPNDRRGTQDISVAVHIAGRDRLADAAPMLRELARVRSFSPDGSVKPRRWNGEEVTSRGVESDHMAQAVHHALRRLGEVPEPRTLVILSATCNGQWVTYECPRLDDSRETLARAIKPGAGIQYVLSTIGAPDRAGYSGTWEYDVDAPKPYTLQVQFANYGSDPNVEKVERLEPPSWDRGDEPYRHHMNGW